MGKGFNNYMTKKFFHPGSKDNIKRVWMAQQKTDFEKQKQDELASQYQKEQEMYKNRALLGDEKAKLGLSFMYDAPPGLKKKEKEEPEAEVKFEWQRKYNAPREQYAKNDETILDQPFGIEVRNVRCIKCRKWGHVNTDRICPLFGQDLTAEPPQPSSSAAALLEGMENDGFTLKKSILGRMSNPHAENERIIESEDEDDPEVQFLKSLTPKQKKKLLKKLGKLQKEKDGKISKDKKKKKKKKHKHSKGKDHDSSDSEEEKRKKKKKRKSSASSDEDSTDSTDSEDEREKRHKRNSIKETSSRHGKERQRMYSGERHNMPRQRSRSRDRHVSSQNRKKHDSENSDDHYPTDRRQRNRSHSPERRRQRKEDKSRRRSRSRSSGSEEEVRNDRRRRRSIELSREGERSGHRRRSDSKERSYRTEQKRPRSRSRERRRSRSPRRHRRDSS